MNLEKSPETADANDEIASLIETLFIAEQRLEELTAGEVDTVAGRDGRTFLLRRAQEQLRFREAAKQTALLNELRVLFDMMPALIWFKDTENNILRINQRAADATGKTVAELEGKSMHEIYPQEAAKYFADDLEVIQSGIPKLGIVETLKSPQGKQLWVQTDKVPVSDKDGKVISIVVMAQDITESKQLEQQFRQVQKMESIGTLAGGVAHDFNNILAVIQGYADMLKTDGDLSTQQLDFIEQINAATFRATALTRQLLLFSRKESLQLRDLDLSQSINGMANMLRRILGEDIQVQFKFAMQPLFIHADAGMMDQVLMNLAVNSRDAMTKGGQLVIETSTAEFNESDAAKSAQIRPGKFICLTVSDTGGGIPPENLARIFEPFFTTKEVGKGTGLGLATIFGIVRQHHGWINVDSEVGHGTTFRIYLPRVEKMFPQNAEPPKLTSMPGGNETILLVEDDPSLRASVKITLSRLGYHVLETANGAEALAVWKQHGEVIHLLLTDLIMPGGMTGKDLSEWILNENPKLKVIYASGYSAEVAGADFKLREGVNFLPKPFQSHKLAKIIRDNLDRQP
jgi:two-component system, cell cycle sensor histidine kinase and response regulator CckA